MQINIFIGKASMQLPKNKFRLKKGPEIKHFVAHQMQKYITQGGVQTPQIIYLWI